MPHDTPLITTIVAALVLAFLFGAIANRLKMPPIVGYLIAGVCVGPHSPGFVADQTLAPQLAEIGVILLMFGVGLHFSLRDLLSVKAIAIPGALIRMAFATAMGLGLALLMGWSIMGGLVFGLALAVSSTVVTLKVLQDRHLVDSDRGRVAMGWLVVEDLAMVLALVLIPAFAGASALGGLAGAGTEIAAQPDPFVTLTEQLLNTRLELWAVMGITLIKLLAFVGFMVVVGRRIIPFILHATAHTGSRELFRLAVLAIALGVAAGAAYLFGVSLALGAFFAGMILSESQLSQRAAQETLPLRDAFGVLFFVSVGMLFDPTIIVTQPLPVLATLAIIIFGKSIVGFLLMILFRRPVPAALTISASLAQIGEFSFILAALGISLGVMPEEGRGLILAGAIISIVLNPLVFWLSERLRPRLEAKAPRRLEPELGPVVPDREDQIAPLPTSDSADVLEEVAQPTSLSNHVVLVGYGRVGGVVAEELTRESTPFVLIEDAEGRVLAAREKGIEVIVGNAATSEALRLANVMGARCAVIAIPNAFEAGQATEQCRKLNSAVKIIARAHSDEEVDYLRRLGADEVIMGEREIGLGMIDWLKGEERNSARRDAAPISPRFSGGENILQQARQAQPAEPPAQRAAAFQPVGPVLVPLAEQEPETPEEAKQTALAEAPVAPSPLAGEPVVGTQEAAPDQIVPAVAAFAEVIQLPSPASGEGVPSEAAETSETGAAPLRHEDSWSEVTAEPAAPEVRPREEQSSTAPATEEDAAPNPDGDGRPQGSAAGRVTWAPTARADAPSSYLEAANEARPPSRQDTLDAQADANPASAGVADEAQPVPAADAAWSPMTREEASPSATVDNWQPEPEHEVLPFSTKVPGASWMFEPEPEPEPEQEAIAPPMAEPDPMLEPEQERAETANPEPYAPTPAGAAADPIWSEPAEEPSSHNATADSPSSFDEQERVPAVATAEVIPMPAPRDSVEQQPEMTWGSAANEDPPAPAEDSPAEVPWWMPAPRTDAEEGPAHGAAIPMNNELRGSSAAEAPEPRVSPAAAFRVVPASEIIILPPEPVNPAAPPAEPIEPQRPAFRSEFWEEEEQHGDESSEPQLFATGTGPSPARMRNVQEREADRPPVDDDAWLAALERDLFGSGSTAQDPQLPNEDPGPVPQPIETPQPHEDPVPAPQPIETPRPNEDPQPAPQPIENPVPEEIPPAAPQPVTPPSSPPTRAETDRRTADSDADV